MISPSKTRSESVVLTSKLGVDYHMSYVGPTYPTLPPWPKPIGGDWWAVDNHNKYADYLKHNGELDMAFTEEQIRARFDAAEAYQDTLEEAMLKVCPEEIVKNFRNGEEGKLFRVFLIEPGMEMEQGIWSCQSSPDADKDLGIEPFELLLETAEAFDYRWRIRMRTLAAAESLHGDTHYLPEPTQWEEVKAWAQLLVKLGVVGDGG